MFSSLEWSLALRMLKAKRAEGGVTIMTWISLIGITLAVFALITTLAVRSGFRTEFVDTLLGSNAHITVASQARQLEDGRLIPVFDDPQSVLDITKQTPGIIHAMSVVRGQVMAQTNGQNGGADVHGAKAADLQQLPGLSLLEGSWADFEAGDGLMMGHEMAKVLGVSLGDTLTLVSPDGVKTAFGTSPRVGSYPIKAIFTANRYDIDRARIYMPYEEAQYFFNRDGLTDEIQAFSNDPEHIETLQLALIERLEGVRVWTWKDAAGGFLRALDIEDRVMFVILSVLVMIASMNIISGLVMLTKNKRATIGVLRTIGLSQGSIMRIFFLCGATLGLIGTILGTILGIVFSLNIDKVMELLNRVSGGSAWDASVRGVYALPANVEAGDVILAITLSLGMSFLATIVPARSAARLDPVEALRHDD